MHRNHRILGSLTLVLGAVSATAHADSRLFYERHLNRAQEVSVPSLFNWATRPFRAGAGIRQDWFDQKISHNDPKDDRTFKQRYYINSDFAQNADAPVFLYICGEGECTDRSLRGVIAAQARAHGAHLISLEHRYYGKSVPVSDFSTENLRHLTIEAALEDLAQFQKFAQNRLGLKGPWVAFGGSYPGSLAAYYRQKHPELVVGALASSAPVRAKESFDEYDRHVALMAGPECLRNIRAVVTGLEEAMNDPQQWNEAKALFGAEEVRDTRDFFYLVADVAAAAVQYGMREDFCSHLAGNGEVEGGLAGYAQFAKNLFSTWDMTPVQFSPQGAESLDASSSSIGVRQWYYQSCTEYGYWQVAEADLAKSARSWQINLEYHHELCRRFFGLNTRADIAGTNRKYYAPLMSAETQNIFFTNGSEDPWSNLSILPGSADAEKNPGLLTRIIEGGSHCDDLGTPSTADSASLTQVRNDFSAELSSWLRRP